MKDSNHSKPLKKVSVPAQKFIETYVLAVKNGHDSEYIAKKLGMSARRVHTRASKYRKLGVQLPYMPTHRKPVNIKELNDWIQRKWAQ